MVTMIKEKFQKIIPKIAKNVCNHFSAATHRKLGKSLWPGWAARSQRPSQTPIVPSSRNHWTCWLRSSEEHALHRCTQSTVILPVNWLHGLATRKHHRTACRDIILKSYGVAVFYSAGVTRSARRVTHSIMSAIRLQPCRDVICAITVAILRPRHI